MKTKKIESYFDIVPELEVEKESGLVLEPERQERLEKLVDMSDEHHYVGLKIKVKLKFNTKYSVDYCITQK